jgi:hypothetical protein
MLWDAELGGTALGRAAKNEIPAGKKGAISFFLSIEGLLSKILIRALPWNELQPLGMAWPVALLASGHPTRLLTFRCSRIVSLNPPELTPWPALTHERL